MLFMTTLLTVLICRQLDGLISSTLMTFISLTSARNAFRAMNLARRDLLNILCRARKCCEPVAVNSAEKMDGVQLRLLRMACRKYDPSGR